MNRLTCHFRYVVCVMLGIALVSYAPAWAEETAPQNIATTTTPNPEVEARAQYLFHLLRCVVCAGQSLADSNALLADDMRGLVRKQVANGRTDEEILDYFVAQYGEQVLMRPPVNFKNGFLWLLPILLLVFGASRIYNYFYHQPND